MYTRTLYPVFAIALALCFVFTGTALAAAPTLLDRVNEALQTAGLPVNAQTQQSFAAGVASGHYKSFQQLVNAMKWHKAHGRTVADVDAFKPMQKLWKFKGTVTEVNESRLETVGLNAKGMQVMPKFRITKNTRIQHGTLLLEVSNDIRTEVKDEIRRDSVVTIWATRSNEAIIIENMAPQGQADFYGQVDCTLCGTATQEIAKQSVSQQEEQQQNDD